MVDVDENLTPRSTYSQVVPPPAIGGLGVDAMTDWLVGVKRENDELRHQNTELETLVEEARSLASEVQNVRKKPVPMDQREEQERKIFQQHNEIVEKASSVCGSRPGSACSSRFSVIQNARPTSAKSWRRPTEKPVSRPGSRPTSAATSCAEDIPMYGGGAPSIVDSQFNFSMNLEALQSPKSNGPVLRSFHVQLDRSIGGSLGMKIRNAGTVLEITKVKDEGLVSVWNCTNPSMAILKGDRIVEVNGKRGNAEELLQECTQPVFLRFVVETRREMDETASSKAPSRVAEPTLAQWCHSRILRLLYQHDCEVIAQLDKIMEQFKGREVTLYEAMCAKYGVEPEKKPEMPAST